jgi:hypothetical protein
MVSWHTNKHTSLLGSSNLSVPPTLYVSCARGDKHSRTICCAAATCSAGTVMVSTCTRHVTTGSGELLVLQCRLWHQVRHLYCPSSTDNLCR